MKQQTAIREAINILEKQRDYLKEMDLLGVLLENEFIHKSNQINTIQLVLSRLLEKEKQQIIDAYEQGKDDLCDISYKIRIREGEQYFTETFKQN